VHVYQTLYQFGSIECIGEFVEDLAHDFFVGHIRAIVIEARCIKDTTSLAVKVYFEVVNRTRACADGWFSIICEQLRSAEDE
jgi:hypothetical protein